MRLFKRSMVKSAFRLPGVRITEAHIYVPVEEALSSSTCHQRRTWEVEAVHTPLEHLAVPDPSTCSAGDSRPQGRWHGHLTCSQERPWDAVRHG